MKKNFLSNYLLSIFSLIILCFIISMPVETNAKSPYPPSGGEDSGEPITPGTPSTESVTEESASNIDSPSSVDAFTCTKLHDCLHLKTAVTRVDEKTLLINRKWGGHGAFRGL